MHGVGRKCAPAGTSSGCRGSRTRFAFAVLVLAIAFLPASGALADDGTDVPQTTWVPSGGKVYSVAVSGSTAYLGGDFGYVGPQSGSFVALPSDLQSVAPGWPTVGGNVFASAPDGSGGWYIGGDFSDVGNVAVQNLAHIRSDGSVDTTWTPGTDGPVDALAVAGNQVFAGGGFANAFSTAYQTATEMPRNDLAAFNTTNGLVEPWDPDVTTTAAGGLEFVATIGVSGSTVYVGGAFDRVNAGAIARDDLAAFNDANGAAASWDPSVSGGTALPGSGTPETAVFALLFSGSDVYVGGDFTAANESSTPVTRNYLAAFDETNGTATSWDPDADGIVYALGASGSTIYAGGAFDTVNGATTRHRLAALDSTSGAASSWNPNVTGTVYAIAAAGSSVYAGGDFQTVNSNLPVDNLAGFNNTSGAASVGGGRADGTVETISVSGGSAVFAGGDFQAYAGDRRNNLAAIDLGTGQATSWNPNVDGVVASVAVSGSTVYAGGDFSEVNGSTARNDAAAFDAASGTATAWNPDLNATVQTLIVFGPTVYTGGNFTSVNQGTTPTARNHLASFDSTTGAVTSWNPNVGGATPAVYALAQSGSTIYAGGSFSTVNGGTARNDIAAFDATSGTASSWNPDIGGTPVEGGAPAVFAIAPLGQTVYAGGAFSTVNGSITRNNAAAFGATSGTATSWNPDTDDAVNALVATNAAIFAGGDFAGFVGTGGSIRNFLADFDPGNGAELPWNPDADGPVDALALTPTSLVAGGEFSAFGFGQNDQAGLAAFDVPGVPTGVSATASGTGSATVSFTAAPANGAEIDEYVITSSGGQMALSGSSPATINGLIPGQTYTFTVTARSVIGTGPVSAPSNSITLASSGGGGAGGGGGGGGGGASDAISVSVSPATQTVASGAQATWSVVVTNTGGSSLSSVGVSGSVASGCNQSPGTLGPGVSTTYSCSLAGATSSYTNTVTASGTGPDARVVTASASASVTVQPAPTSTVPTTTIPAPKPKVTVTLATLGVSGLELVLIHKKRALRLTVKLSKATVLRFVLVNAKGHVLERWTIHARKGKTVVSRVLLGKARAAGHDKLELTQTGAKKPKVYRVTIKT